MFIEGTGRGKAEQRIDELMNLLVVLMEIRTHLKKGYIGSKSSHSPNNKKNNAFRCMTCRLRRR